MIKNKIIRKQTRLLKTADYQLCYLLGEKFHTRHFIIYLLSVPDCQGRYGMTVSRKTGNAVLRNRIKRLIREFFRNRINRLYGCQIVVTVKRDAPYLNLDLVEKELSPVLLPYYSSTLSNAR